MDTRIVIMFGKAQVLPSDDKGTFTALETLLDSNYKASSVGKSELVKEAWDMPEIVVKLTEYNVTPATPAGKDEDGKDIPAQPEVLTQKRSKAMTVKDIQAKYNKSKEYNEAIDALDASAAFKDWCETAVLEGEQPSKGKKATPDKLAFLKSAR